MKRWHLSDEEKAEPVRKFIGEHLLAALSTRLAAQKAAEVSQYAN
jgi:hypothetical protein